MIFGHEPQFSKPSKLVKIGKNCKTIWLAFLKILTKILWGYQIHEEPKFTVSRFCNIEGFILAFGSLDYQPVLKGGSGNIFFRQYLRPKDFFDWLLIVLCEIVCLQITMMLRKVQTLRKSFISIFKNFWKRNFWTWSITAYRSQRKTSREITLILFLYELIYVSSTCLHFFHLLFYLRTCIRNEIDNKM